MKVRRLFATIPLSFLLIFLLVFQTIARVSPRASSLPVPLETVDETTRELGLELVGPFLQEDVLDGATKSFMMRMGQPGSVRYEVAEAVLKTVSQKGYKLVGVGSWITGKKFVEGSSDFDMRLVMPPGTSEAEAVKAWGAVRENLIGNVRAKFGDQADNVLRKMNLYPPEVVLDGIDDAGDALAKLTSEVRINPNLGGAVTEGLWGKGAKAFRDTYESTAGRAFWTVVDSNGNKTLASGFADLLPLGETRSVYTIAGTANSAAQFADKIDDALLNNDAKTVKKQLNRLRQELAKSRSLAAMEKSTYLDDLLTKLKDFDDTPEGLARLRSQLSEPLDPLYKQIKQAVGRAKMDSALLKKFAESSNPRDLKVLKEMLEEGTGRWARVKNALSEASSHVPWGALTKAFMAFLIVIQTKQVVNDWRAADYENAFQGILTEVGFFVSLPAGILTLVVSAIIEDAKDAGYSLVASYQDCEDMLAGIYEVKGRERISNEQKAETNVNQLAKNVAENDEIIKKVSDHARSAATKTDGGAVTRKVDSEIEKKLIARCTPEILRKWTLRRAEMIGDAVAILSTFKDRMAGIDARWNVSPDPAVLKDGKASATADAVFSSSGLAESKVLEQYIDALRQLGGEKRLVAVSVKHSYRWLKDGAEDSYEIEDMLPGKPLINRELTRREFNFTDSDPHTAQLEYILSINVLTSADDIMAAKNYLTWTFSKKIPFEIEVVEQKVPSPTPTPVSDKEPPVAGTVRLVAPTEVMATDLVDIKALIPPEILSKAKTSEWFPQSCSAEKQIDSAKLQFANPRDGKPSQTYVQYTLKGADTYNVGQANHTILVKPVLFKGSSSDIWTANSWAGGLVVDRKAAIRKFEDKDSGIVRGRVEVVWADSFAPKTLEEIQADLKRAKGDNPGVTLEPITVAGFKGYLLELKDIKQGSTGSGYVDLGLPNTEKSGWGYGIKNCIAIKFSYTAYGGGVIRGEKPNIWWNDIPFIMSQTRAAAAEAKAILSGLSLGPDGTFSKTPYKGPKLDGSDMPVVKLVLSPDNRKLRKGEIVNVQAVIENEENADKPLSFDWTGDHAGTGATVQFMATKPGKQALSVNVPNVGFASVEFEVEDLRAEIRQIAPATAKVMVGTPARFSAKMMSVGRALSGDFVYRWQPTPDVRFDPAESSGTETAAIFSRPGRQRVFVQVLERKGETLQTLAESEAIEIEVVKPNFKIRFTPENAAVGKPIIAMVDVEPADLKDIDFRWELSSNGKQTLQSSDARQITLIPQDAKPVTVTVRARVPFTGDDLGSQTATITAQKLDVKVSVLGAEGPKPQIWKEGIGLVALETGLAVNQFVGIRADVSPAQEGLRYEWTLNQDSHFAGNSSGQQIRVSRSQVGTCEATVIVRDKNGIELGRAAGSFEVSVSQFDLDNSQKRASAAAKLTQAKQLVLKGKLDEGIALSDEVQGIDQKNNEAATLSNKWKGERSTIQSQLTRVRSLITQKKFIDAGKTLSDAKQLHPLYEPVLAAERELNESSSGNAAKKRDSEAQTKQGNDLLDQRSFQPALNAFNNALAADPNSAPALAGRCMAKRGVGDTSASADCDRALQLDPDNATALRGRSLIKRSNNDLIGALADADRSIVLDPQNHRTYVTRGLVKQSQKDFNGALSDYETSMRINPNYAMAHYYRGGIRSIQKDYRGAISDLDRSIQLDPNYAFAWYDRGTAKLNFGDNQGALSDLNKFVVMNPTYSNGFNNRGLVHERLGNTDKAISDYEAALAIDSANEIAKANLARLKKSSSLPDSSAKGNQTFYPMDLTPIGGKKGPVRKLQGIDVDDGSYVRLKSTDEKRLTYTIQVPTRFQTDRVAFVSNLDDAIHVPQGATIARMTIIKSSGEEKFDLKAGIHSSEWNRGDGPTKHNATEALQTFDLARPGAVTAIRFDYVETNAEKWWGHAPGFCLKGLTLIGSSSTTTSGNQNVTNTPSAADLAYSKKFTGSWNSNWGELVFVVDGVKVTGNYTHDQGRIEATLSADGRTMEGVWMEAPTYKPPRDGGRVTFAISADGKTINGHWWYDQRTEGGDWTGTRIVSSTTPKTSPTPPKAAVAEIFSNMNTGGVSNQPTAPTQFTVTKAYMVTSIMNYHWNGGTGTSQPGRISLRRSDGTVFGPWSATGIDIGTRVPNGFWEAKPAIVIPAGTYTVVDSDPATWAQNGQSGGRGFSIVTGYATDTPPSTPPVSFSGRWTGTYRNTLGDSGQSTLTLRDDGVKITGDQDGVPFTNATREGSTVRWSSWTASNGILGSTTYFVEITMVGPGKISCTYRAEAATTKYSGSIDYTRQ